MLISKSKITFSQFEQKVIISRNNQFIPDRAVTFRYSVEKKRVKKFIKNGPYKLTAQT